MAEIVHHLLLSLLVIVLISFGASDISVQNMKCETTCGLNYSHNAAEVGYCCRGCRLMRLADFATYGYPSQNTADLLQTCTDSCTNAYSGDVSATARTVCQHGCKFELPAVENRLRQLQMFYYEQSKYVQMFDMINKLMSCHVQSFMYGRQQLAGPDDRYFRASVVIISSDGGSVNGISMSRGSEASVKTDDREVADSGRKVTGRVMEGKSRLYTRVGRSDPAVVLFLLFGLVLLIGLSASLCYPTQQASPPAKPQKLSMYGDGDFLSTLDEDDTLIDIKPRAQLFMAAPLPAKSAQ